MTSWRYVTHLFLFVLLSKINLSKGGCHDYFNINSWAKNLTETISLVKTKNSEDIVECTVERECLQGRNICHILYQCFQRTVEVKEISEKCKGTTFQTVPYYHFMCLTARAFNHIPEGCKYETVCELYRKEPSTGQTLQSMNKTGNNNAENTEILTLKILLMISVAFHVLVPLAVYRYMRRQVSAELSDTLPASVYGNQVENSHLMQPLGCDSVVTQKVQRNDCSVRSEILH